MNGWLEKLQSAVDYMEEHLPEEIDVGAAAARAGLSSFYFQRIFGALYGGTVWEYIRARRLSLAGQELSSGGTRVIDAALKYGYDSPDSFARAFTRFHGIPPSAAKKQGALLKTVAPIQIRIVLEGGTMMEYKIVEKAAFTVAGSGRSFHMDTSYAEIPKWWDEVMGDESKPVTGMFGACLDAEGAEFGYMIADLYAPWKPLPEGFATRAFDAGLWAVFPCRGPLPKALQDVNSAIWKEWLPNCREYELAGNYSLEFYSEDKAYSEIWIPVKKK